VTLQGELETRGRMDIPVAYRDLRRCASYVAWNLGSIKYKVVARCEQKLNGRNFIFKSCG
jgi:hypothetical protein